MTDFDPEALVLSVFKEKCRRAGGLKAGYNLRREAIQYGGTDDEKTASDEALGSLVERGLLAGNEGGDRFILTEEGVAALSD